MKRLSKIASSLLFLVGVFLPTHAQVQVDVLSIIAYNKAEETSSLLKTRAGLEYTNTALHEAAAAANINYKEINIELDKYTKFFDLLDGLLATVNAYMDGRSTYQTIRQRIEDYKKILNDYETKCLARGDIQSTDAQIIEINRRAINKIITEVDYIVEDIKNLAKFVNPLSAHYISAADYAWLINRIDTTLIRIRDLVNSAYIDTWNYITVRTNLWKKEIYLARDKQQMAMDALGRWAKAIEDVNSSINKKPIKK